MSGLHQMYSISYMWYAVIGTIICVTLGLIVSVATSRDSDAYDERLLHPLIAKLARKLPGPKRNFTVEKSVEEKTEPSEQTEETVAEEKPTVFVTTSSRLFEAYEAKRSPTPVRTRL